MPQTIFILSEEDYNRDQERLAQLEKRLALFEKVVKATATQAEAEEITGLGYTALKTERERPGTCIKYSKGNGKNGHITYDLLSLLEFAEQRRIQPLQPLKLTA